MSFFKKFKKSKKSRQSPQQPTSLGIATQIAVGALGINAGLDLDVGPGGETNARGSRIAFRDSSEVQRPRPSGASTPIRDREDGVASVHELYERNTPSDNAKERTGYVTPDLSIAGGEQGVRDQEKCEGRETVGEQPPEVFVEDSLKGNRVGEDVYKGTPGGNLEDRPVGSSTTPVDDKTTRGFGSLKFILSEVSTDHKGNLAVGNKVEGLLSRINALEERFDSLPGDLAEQRRRDTVIQKLEDIEGRLRMSSENPEPQQPVSPVQNHGQVSGLLEDLRDAIFAYQMALQQAIYEQGCRSIVPAEVSVLNNFRCARGAEYRHGGRKGCLKGTREVVLDEIELWTRDFDKLPVYWLNGLAGTGKSTIAQTIAERVFADGRLGASFFCSRDFEDRSNLQLIFPTLAFQLARKYTEFRSVFVPLVESDPDIAHESLYSQMDKLIMQPLRESGISTVIVIDALDECKDEEPASAILSVLGRFVSELPKVKFLLTGRPEPHIRGGFRLPLLVGMADIFVLHEVKPNQVDSDLRLFFKYSFSELTQRQEGLENWPTTSQLDLLCKRAVGLFVYAVATVKFIDNRNIDPRRQLDLLLHLPENTSYEGRTKFNANTTLDLLYTSILQEAFGNVGPESVPIVHSVICVVILATNPLSPSSIATLLGFDIQDVTLPLLSVHSLLILHDDLNCPVQPFHKSFPDFITNPTRCTNQKFHVAPHHHLELLISCLNLMNQTLEKNMCHLPEAVKNSDVKDLEERTEKHINHALQYACESWHKHLVNGPTTKRDEITSVLQSFLEKKFLCWLEVLSVLSAVRNAVDALQVAVKWLKESKTLDLANDCFRFVTRFIEGINVSAPHIYHSALVLCPKESIVQRLYGPQAKPMARVIQGIPASWDPSIAIIRFPYKISATAWSPCSRFIAAAHEGSSEIAILDAVTLEHLNGMYYPMEQARWKYIIFSPDSRVLTAYSWIKDCILSWDLQTGGLLNKISTKEDGHCNSVSHSGCGTMVGGMFGNKTINIYNIISGKHTCSHSIQQHIVSAIWTHKEYLQFATLGSESVALWQVGFTSSNPPTVFGSLPTPDNFFPEGLVLLPTLSLLAFILNRNLMLWDTQNQKYLLDSADVDDPRAMSFSPDSHSFVCGTNGKGFHVWKKSPTGYHSPQMFISGAAYPTPLVSPNGESVISSGGNILQLWLVADSLTSPPVTSVQLPHDIKWFFVEFSPDESLVAVTERLSSIDTVLDLKSGNPWLVIDTDTENCGLRMTGDKIIVVGDGKIITWDLSARGSIFNTRRNINNSSLITTFRHSAPIVQLYASISPNLSHVAFGNTEDVEDALSIYNIHTGEKLVSADSNKVRPGFTPCNNGVWMAIGDGDVEKWEIVEGDGSDAIKLKKVGEDIEPQSGFPWNSIYGYQVTNSGWITCSSGKWLLWLPHHLRQDAKAQRKWDRRFLALWNNNSSWPCLLQLEP